MRTVVIMREPSTDAGTFGTLTVDHGKSFFSGELPDRGNKRGLSCVRAGSFLCKWLLSPTHGWCYHVINVPGRSEIEIHSCNFLGDKMLVNPKTGEKYKCDMLGCIGLGKKIRVLDGQRALIESRAAIEEFNADLNREDFQLVIHDAPALDVGGDISVG